MKKKCSIVAACLLILSCVMGLASCGGGETHTHEYVHHAAATANCGEAGHREYWSCTGCEKLFSDEHGSEIADLAAVTIPATGEHTLGEWSKDASGHWRDCSVCNQKVDVAQHVWDAGVVTGEPTCGADGFKTFTCTVCGQSRTETIPATGEHTLGEWSKDASGHWRDCSVCEQKLDTAQHVWDAGVVTGEPTCGADGVKTFACTVCGQSRTETIPATGEHTLGEWSKDASGHWRDCTVCGQKLDTAQHVWDAGVVTGEPTCGADGVKTFACTVCGHSKTETVSATGEHTLGEWSKDASGHWRDCTVCGQKLDTAQHVWEEKVCTVCGAQKSTEGLSYTLSNGGYTVTGPGTATDTDIYIPAEYNGYPVTGIGERAFANRAGLTSVRIPDTVRRIGNSAFYDCSSLTSITIPDSVTSIGSSAFTGCSGLIEKESGVSYVNKWAVDCDTDVAEVALRADTVGIGDQAFFRRTGLTSIAIPASVTRIGFHAFFGCEGLTSITLPFIGAMKNGTENTHFGYIFGAESSLNNGGYVPASLKTVVITAGVTRIESSAFSGCEGLTGIAIPDSMTRIGPSAFSGCASLTSITIPDGVTSIGVEAFYDCSSLTSVTIGSGVTSIGENAFTRCASLTGITIPDGVTSIGDHAFSGCGRLTSVTIGSGVTSIGSYAFYDCISLTGITIPDGVTGIGDWTFSGCARLTSVTIGNGVTSIGSYAFSGCSGLTSVTFAGTTAQWQAIRKGGYWDSNTGNFTITCTDGMINQ